MTAPHSISDGSAGALEYLSVFADSGYYGLSNVQVRAICAALRTPALPSGEVEGIGPTDCAEHMLLQARAKGYEGWTNIYAAQLAHFATYCDVRATSLQPRPTIPPFSRWADTIESASLTISPEGSEALNALAAEVRAGGAAQGVPEPEAYRETVRQIAAVREKRMAEMREALERIRNFPHDKTACEQAMSQIAGEALAMSSTSRGTEA